MEALRVHDHFPEVRPAPQPAPRKRPLLARPGAERLFIFLARFIIASALVVLVALIGDVAIDGAARLHLDFFLNFPSRKAENAGILAAWTGSLWLLLLTISFALPLGIGAAVYLEEYGKKNRFAKLLELCIANLAGVPSVIYGILGLQVFVRTLGFERSLLSGALTLALLVLPIIIMATREALRTVPKGYREGALALGATKWQTVWTQVLPVALPGIATGCILAFSRAIGETAPLITLGALTYVAQVPDSIFSPFTALPIQAFNWLSRPQTEFHTNAAAAITVLLTFMIALNLIAIVIRARFQKRQR
ncbi:MAG: phosphate ABC transporter permease PstA [Planctomycetota bacterium]|nr:MAG: phosphate ABC transporter permease PstA [Planctomycetota bacterium]